MRPQTFIVNQTMITIIQHHVLFMWNHYRWIIGREHRKRERYIAKWGEGDRTKTERKYSMGLIEDSYFWFWPIVLNQHKYFWISQLAISTWNLFWDACIMKSTRATFLEEVFTFQWFFWCYDFYSNNHEVFHKISKF